MDPYCWWGHGFGFGWMWIFPLIFLVICLFFAFGFFLRGPGRFRQDAGRAGSDESAREVLDRRYAKGEITKEQYEEMKHALKA